MGRAFGPGPPAPFPEESVLSRARTSVVAVLAAAALTAGCGSSSHPSHRTTEPPLGFRTPPSFLPTTSAPVDRVVVARPGTPRLAVQGVGVSVHLPTGTALATIVGPHVPPFVSPPPETVTATFDVTLSDVTGRVPVRLRDFVITDQLGHSYRPTYVTGARHPAALAATGRATTFQVTAVMPTGEGRIYWTAGQAKPVVGWDFIVEND